jgi:hypothetical protein
MHGICTPFQAPARYDVFGSWLDFVLCPPSIPQGAPFAAYAQENLHFLWAVIHELLPLKCL